MTFQDVVAFLGPALLGLVSLLLTMVLSRLKNAETEIKDLGKTLADFVRECVTKDAHFVDAEQCRKFHDRCHDAMVNEFRRRHEKEMQSLWHAIRFHHHTNPNSLSDDRVIVNGSKHVLP